MKKQLIEDIASANAIFISDLHDKKVLFYTLPYIWTCEGYELTEWVKLIKYVFHETICAKNEADAKNYYTGKVMKELLTDSNDFVLERNPVKKKHKNTM